MGSLDGAECCEIIGLYLLSLLSDVIDKESMGLFRDDGLAMIEGSGPEVERLRKKVMKIFKDQGLQVTIEANLKITEFLDVQFNLETGEYRPYTKPNNKLSYVSAKSNHPPHIKCRLCMAEKTFILYGNKSKMLNKRSEIMGICRHRRAHKLSKLL